MRPHEDMAQQALIDLQTAIENQVREAVAGLPREVRSAMLLGVAETLADEAQVLRRPNNPPTKD